MIILGIGSNLPNPDIGPPRANCGAALEKLEKLNISIVLRSPWYESQPVPESKQPWYVNGVIAVETFLAPFTLMERLLEVELDLGRRRAKSNGPRTIDLDILAYNDTVIDPPIINHLQLHIPHPRMHLRSFVMKPLCDISPNWQHPILGQSAEKLRNKLPPEQKIRRMVDANGIFGTEWSPERQ